MALSAGVSRSPAVFDIHGLSELIVVEEHQWGVLCFSQADYRYDDRGDRDRQEGDSLTADTVPPMSELSLNQ